MSTSSPSFPLPTLDRLGASPESIKGIDANATHKIISDWFTSFEQAISSSNASAFSKLFVPESYWRDLLAFTWDFRTLAGQDAISQFAQKRLLIKDTATNLKLRDLDKPWTGLQPLGPDLVWIQASFSFDTKAGPGIGIFRLVPTQSTGSKDAAWKAHCVFTALDDLHNHPEMSGALRNHTPDHGLWEARRKEEVEFKGRDPTVLIIGGGQAGLDMAARLKYRGVSTLIVDKNAKVGDNWRSRYTSLCLHDPVWYDHMPYIPFPPTWPVYTPAAKLAKWLESYADAMELNIWGSTEVSNISRDEKTGLWHVSVKSKAQGRDRTFKVKHVVFATGWAGKAVVPEIPGMDEFKGVKCHSSEYSSAKDHVGKKVLVVGTGSSAHDIASELSDYGVDVTIYQRSPTHIVSGQKGVQGAILGPFYSENAPPTEVSDQLFASFPNLLLEKMNQRALPAVEEIDKELLDGLKKVGFKLGRGYKDSGLWLTVMDKAGGYYINVGGSERVISGAIKLKSDAQISNLTADAVKFDDGSEIKCDVIVFATGFTSPREYITSMLDETVSKKLNKIWGMNGEGEMNGVWRDDLLPGSKGLWYMIGNLALCRFYSKYLALQIKAMEEGLYGEKY